MILIKDHLARDTKGVSKIPIPVDRRWTHRSPPGSFEVIERGHVICVTDGNDVACSEVPSTAAESGEHAVPPFPARRTRNDMFTRKSTIHPALRASDMGVAVPAAELETLQRLATTIQVPAGEEIMRKDGVGRECFVVIDGQFEVQLDDSRILVGPGSVMGELALLTLKPRTATVTATIDSSVYVLTRAEFATIVDVCPNLGRYVLDGAVRRSTAA